MLVARPERFERDHTVDPRSRQSRLSANRHENLSLIWTRQDKIELVHTGG
jgi:hypothetical protein